ncbi:MAG: Coenzyme F420 hydrogenase/dehydrogenase, beta subunit C-terminal domain [Clostridia bacterium]|nr:Coenzyme F420 hydrogenase/dehydrogenase, beta subunit C-terminal domain [Clostridia bacterium]
MSYSVYERKEDCCGCTACMNICPKGAITMQADEEGFLYPEIDGKRCIECGLCKKICAFQKEELSLEEMPQVYAVKASDEIRRQSSSGGCFTAFSDVILQKGGAVYGCAFDEKLKAEHIRAENERERDRCRGSKYSQSDLGTIFSSVKEDLKAGREVLFTGTTCQTAALREVLSEQEQKNLYTVDIICHGTPSPRLFADFIEYIEQKRNKKVKAYYHRPKDLGWRGGEKLIYADGKKESRTTLVDGWRNIFYGDLALRPSCYQCRYSNPCRPSDITIADFWGIEGYAPEFSDALGVSLALVSSEKGRRLFEACRSSLQIIERTMEEAVVKNPNLKVPTARPAARTQFWALYKEGGFPAIMRLYGKDTLKQKIKYAIKAIMRKCGLFALAKKILKK